MRKTNWTAIGVFAVVVLLTFLVGVSLLGGGRYGGWGMMGGHMGWPGGMMGWGFGPFGWIGMILMWLFPLGFLVLIVLGILWLVRAVSGGSQPTPLPQTCPACGRNVQSDWRNCPYCGNSLTSA